VALFLEEVLERARGAVFNKKVQVAILWVLEGLVELYYSRVVELLKDHFLNENLLDSVFSYEKLWNNLLQCILVSQRAVRKVLNTPLFYLQVDKMSSINSPVRP